MGDVEMSEENQTTGLEIAVIGMAGRFPGARDVNEFWDNLKNGVESIVFFRDEELIEAGINRQYVEDPDYVNGRGFLESSEYFDAAFFGYTPAEAAVMDPQLRFFHECAWEALEDAGCDPDTYEGLIGVYFGASDNLQWKVRVFANGGAGGNDFGGSLLSSTDLLATRLSYQLNLTGPSTTINSACSTSLVAIHRACRGLLGGECDIALAGGVSISVPQKCGYFYQEGMIDSPDGHCRAFDAQANGTVFGSGIGVVILKRLDEAIEEGNHIYAVIKGSTVNNDGKRKIGYTAPSVEGQIDVIHAACQVAEVEPDSIGYIETHGTGTTLGDPIEIKALVQGMKRNAANRCPIGAVKTNIGHLDAAAGVAGFIKTVLCLTHRMISPTLHFNVPNPELELETTPFYVNTRLLEWERQEDQPLRAGVSSFGIGGTNAHVILEEAPVIDRLSSVIGENKTGKEREYQLILLSAKTASALDKVSQNLAEHLKTHPNIELGDVAYTLQKGRKAFVHRKALVCSTVDETIAALSTPNSPAVQTAVSTEEYRQTVFMFAGQGSQYVNMGLGLYLEETVFREEMDRCFDILTPMLGVPIKEILYPSFSVSSDFGVRSPTASVAKNINQTEITQPIIFAFEYALAKQLMYWGITADAMIGYSFGEYVAACLAGVFSLEDALALIVLRGRLMQQMPTGAMLSVPLPEEELKPLLSDDLAIAIVNEPACIVAGPEQSIERFEKEMKQRRLLCMRLSADFAPHSSIMNDAAGVFREQLRQIRLNEPRIPYISGITGDWINPGEAADYRYWVRHLRETVRFSSGIQQLLKEKPGPCIFIEIGPGRDLAVLVKRYIENESHKQVINLIRPQRKEVGDMSYLLRQVGKLWLYRQRIDWQALHSAEKRHLVSLPPYPFEGKRYWIDEDSFNSFLENFFNSKEKAARREDISQWFYLPSWKRSSLVKGLIPANTLCLIFSQTYGPGAGLVKKLEQEGVETVLVTRGAGFSRQTPSHYTLDPAEGPHYDMLLGELCRENRPPLWIVHLWNVTEEKEWPELTVEKMEDAQYPGFYSLLYLAQAISNRDIEENIRILVVSNHMYNVIGEEVRCPEKATLLGPVKVIPQEYPNIHCRQVDIENPVKGGPEEEQLVRQLLMEMTADTSDPVAAYRRNQRWVQVFEPILLKKPGKQMEISYLKERGVYLITGGLGGMGLVLAEYLARQVKARLVLTSRSGRVERQQRNKLQELAKMGAEVLTAAADAADGQKVRAVIRQAKERFGTIHGIIHAAGSVDYGGIIQGRREKAGITEAVFAPKLKGTLLLEKLLHEEGITPDFIILCSSIASLVGPFGEVAYSAANAFLDAYSHYRMHYFPVHHDQLETDPHQTKVCSMNWSLWQQVGMAVEAVKRKGGNPDTALEGGILPAEGMEVFERVLHHEFSQVVVSPVDLDQMVEEPQDVWKHYRIHLGDTAITGTESSVQQVHQRPELDTAYAAPENEHQQELAEIWQRFFGLDQVGIDDDFFDLGGDSLKAMAVAGLIQKEFNFKLTLAEFFKYSTIRELAKYIGGSAAKEYSYIHVAEEREHYPLSPAQKRLYILHQMEPDNIIYNEPSIVPLGTEVDLSRFEHILNQMIRRHESLRTSFHMVSDEPVQKIHDDVEFEIQLIHISSSGHLSQEEISATIMERFVLPFDLSKAPLLRVGVIKNGEERYVAAIDIHHIIADGRTQEIFISEMMAVYAGKELAPLRVQYNDYAQWLNGRVIQETINVQEAYWLKQFEGSLPILDLALDYTRPRVQSFAGNTLYFTMGKEKRESLKQLAIRENVTMFMLLLGLFNVLLFKLSGQEDIVVGTLIAGRENADLQNVMGMFANTLPLRNFPEGGISVTVFLQRLKERTLEAFENQDYPFEELVERVKVSRDTGRNPIFDVVFTHQPFSSGPVNPTSINPGTSRGETAEAFVYDNPIVRFDMVLTALEGVEDLVFKWDYCTTLFKAGTLQRFADYFKQVISSVLENPGKNLAEIEVVTEEERKQILYDFNDVASPYPKDKTIHQLFEEQAARAPGHTAVIGVEQRQITYGELNRKANQLAYWLKEKCVLADSIVGIMVYRSIEMIIGLLGILKAGAAYLPIDPEYPQERIGYMLKDCKAKVLLTSSATMVKVEEGSTEVIDLSEQIFSSTSTSTSTCKVSSANLAYVIYTSGTTGKPKGTLTSHFNVNRVVRNTNYIDITTNDRILQLSNYAFDGSVFDIYGALLNGAVLVMIKQEEVFWLERLADLIKREGITVFFVTTALFNKLVEMEIGCLKNVRKVLFGGEKVSVEHSQKALEHLEKGRIIHVYGPTETTVYATHYFIDDIDENAATIPIGKPISNTTVYILDKNNAPVPFGVVGELYIGGDGTARGYLNNPELTAERFVFICNRSHRTYRTYISKKLYKTGDLVRWLVDGSGNIEFLGRIDHQVKIRGFRVEPGEIETRLLEFRLVKEAVVVPVENDKNLCAYVVPVTSDPQSVMESGDTSSLSLILQLKKELASCLPDYMVPVYFVLMERLPLTPNGKVDRKALPAPEAVSGEAYIGPRDEIEKNLVDMWCHILGRTSSDRSIGIDDNFFDLGGHSLRAAVIISRVHKEFSVKVPLAELFKSPTIRKLAQYIRKGEKTNFIELEKAEEREFYPLSYNQQRLYILQQLNPASSAYNMSKRFWLNEEVDEKIVKDALKTLVERHTSLRTGFKSVNHETVQFVAETIELPFQVVDISATSGGEKQRRWEKVFTDLASVPFDLENLPLFRTVLVRLGTRQYELMFSVHHIVADGWSLEILQKEFLHLYGEYSLGKPVVGLELLPFQYTDFSWWHNRQLEYNVNGNNPAAKFWKQKLTGGIPSLQLPVDFTEGSKLAAGAGYQCMIGEDLKQHLNQLAEQYHTTLFTVMFSVYLLVLFKISNQEDIGCSVIAAGREHIALQHIVGLFVNSILFKVHIDVDEAFERFLQRMNEDVMQALQYQAYPMEPVFEALNMRFPEVSVSFNMLNMQDITGGQQLESFEASHVDAAPDVKFDLEPYITEYENGIWMWWVYRKSLFEPATIEYIINLYIKLLGFFARDSFRSLRDHIEEEKKQKTRRFARR